MMVDIHPLFFPLSSSKSRRVLVFLDWMFMWCFFQRLNALPSLKIFLKDGLRKLPFFGWAMTHLRFIFLTRDWKQDEVSLTKTLASLLACDDPSSFLFFPEGTDLSPSNLRRNNAYAVKKGWPLTTQTLHPRTTGRPPPPPVPHGLLFEFDWTIHNPYDWLVCRRLCPRWIN